MYLLFTTKICYVLGKVHLCNVIIILIFIIIITLYKFLKTFQIFFINRSSCEFYITVFNPLLDSLRWYCDQCSKPVYEEKFHCVDLGTQLKPIIEKYAQTESLRKCTFCGHINAAKWRDEDEKRTGQNNIHIKRRVWIIRYIRCNNWISDPKVISNTVVIDLAETHRQRT